MATAKKPAPKPVPAKPKKVAKPTISLVKIERIGGDPRLQMREGINETVVEEYVEQVKLRQEKGEHGEFPGKPLVTFFDKKEKKEWLADGYQRLEAYKRCGLKSVTVERHEGSFREAWLYALSANAGHGLKRSKNDIAKAIRAVLLDAELKDLSTVKIAELVKCSSQYVSKVKAEIGHSSEAGQRKSAPPPQPRAQPRERDEEDKPRVKRPNIFDGIEQPEPPEGDSELGKNVEESWEESLPTEPATKPDVDADDVDTEDGAKPAGASDPEIESGKKPLPTRIAKDFDNVGDLLGLIKLSSAIKKRLNALRNTRTGLAMRINLQPLIEQLDVVRKNLKACTPMGPCLRCQTTGKITEKGTEKHCNICNGTGIALRKDLSYFTKAEQESLQNDYDLSAANVASIAEELEGDDDDEEGGAE